MMGVELHDFSGEISGLNLEHSLLVDDNIVPLTI